MPVYEHITRKTYRRKGDSNDYLYWVEGDSTKPPFVLLYGLTGIHKDLLDVTRELKKDFFVIIPEFPGWNDCPRFSQPLTIHNYAQYFIRFLKDLKLYDVTLLGHCTGAISAMEMVYLYPQMFKRLFMVSTPYLEGMWVQKFYVLLISLAKFAPQFMKPVFFFWRSRLLTVPMDPYVIQSRSWRIKLARMKEHILLQGKEHEDAVEEEWESYIRYDFRVARKIRKTVHLIHGAKDVLITKRQQERLQTLFQHATLDFIDDAGHVPPVETPLALTNVIRKYK